MTKNFKPDFFLFLFIFSSVISSVDFIFSNSSATSITDGSLSFNVFPLLTCLLFLSFFLFFFLFLTPWVSVIFSVTCVSSMFVLSSVMVASICRLLCALIFFSFFFLFFFTFPMPFELGSLVSAESVCSFLFCVFSFFFWNMLKNTSIL